MTENITKCEAWFWRAFKGGMYLAGNNLRHYYENGDRGYVEPRGVFRPVRHSRGPRRAEAL